MKRILFLILFITIAMFSKAQVFNTSDVLKSGKYMIGLESSLIVHGSKTQFAMYTHGGLGLGSNIDIGVQLGTTQSGNYLGTDIEYGINEKLSLSVGLHKCDSTAIDANINYSIPFFLDTKLITGLDIDYEFHTPRLNAWLPIGLSVDLESGWSAIMKAEIELTNDVHHYYYGIGLSYEF